MTQKSIIIPIGIDVYLKMFSLFSVLYVITELHLSHSLGLSLYRSLNSASCFYLIFANEFFDNNISQVMYIKITNCNND